MIKAYKSTGRFGVKKQRGMNLLEILIVMVIMAIVVSVAYPSYTNQIQKTKRADCAGALASLRGAMERHFTVTGSYLGAGVGGTNSGTPDPSIFVGTCPVDGGTPTYNITILPTTTVSTYAIQAAPVAAQAADKCGSLTLSNTGLKGVTGQHTGVTWQDCW